MEERDEYMSNNLGGFTQIYPVRTSNSEEDEKLMKNYEKLICL